MNQDIRDALARLTHAIENESRANDLLHKRLAEQEQIAVQEREKCERALWQIRDAHNALSSAGIDIESHTPHDDCPTQLGHRVRQLVRQRDDWQRLAELTAERGGVK